MGLGTRGSRSSSSDVIQVHMFLGFLLRLAFVMYGEHHDQTNILKYTDIDYHVVTDAAREVLEGGSPFDRHTYRYTPFLAWLLMPNIQLNFAFGKLLFSFLDCCASRLIYEILILDGQSKKTSLKCSFLWLYNPLVIGVSTRGSAESIMAVLVLLTLYMMKMRLHILSGFFLGAAVHFKLYPIFYSLPLYLSLSHGYQKEVGWKLFLPNISKIRLVCGAAVAFLGLTGMGYVLYGEQYIEEAFLYHFSRTDTRHNFSVYFYLLYIGADFRIPGLSIATFGPQLILVLALGFKYRNYIDVPFAFFTQTVVFVTFNKVVTSQYFMWYLLLLPLVVPRLDISWQKAVVLAILWVGAQVSWLLPAYLLEFHGINAFVPIWLEGIAFFCCNVGVLMALLSSYHSQSPPRHLSARKNR